MTRKHKLGLGFAIGVVGLLIATYLILSYIQSSYLKEKIIPEVISQVESRYPVKLSLGDIQVSLFKGVVIDNLIAHAEVQKLKADIKVERLSVRYSLLSLLSRRVQIDSVLVRNVDIQVDGEFESSKQPSDQSLEETLRHLVDNLNSVPAELVLDELEVSPLNIRTSIRMSPMEISTQLKNISLEMSATAGRGKLEFELALDVPGPDQAVVVKTDLKSTPLQFAPQVKLSFDLDLENENSEWSLEHQGNLDSRVLLNQSEFIDQKATWSGNLRNSKLKTSGSIQIPANVPELAPLRSQGLKSIKESLEAEYKSEFREAKFGFEVQPDLEKQPLDLEISGTLNGSGTLQLADAPKVFGYALEVKLPQLQNPQVKFAGGDLKINGNYQASARPRINTELKFNSLGVSAGFDQDIPISFTATGGLNTDLTDIALRGEASLQSKSGNINIPWRITRPKQGTISIQSDFKSNRFGLDGKALAIKNLVAAVPIQMELRLDGSKGLRFASIITRDPFERVDYSGIRPYVTDFNSNLRFDLARFQNYSVGPLFADVSIRQNLVIAEQYQLNLLEGLAAGHAFVDLNPRQPRVGFLGRVAGLNPKVLTQKQISASDKRISSRMAVVYDFQKSMAEGRLDITEIGGPQLIELINVLDPQYKDGKLNLARSLLKVGHPAYVGIRMSQGFLDLSVDMGGLVSVSGIGIDGVPLTPVLAMIKQDLMEKLKKGNPR